MSEEGNQLMKQTGASPGTSLQRRVTVWRGGQVRRCESAGFNKQSAVISETINYITAIHPSPV